MSRYLRVGAKSIKAMNPFLDFLQRVKEPAHVIAGHGLVRSLPLCIKQDEHKDYFSLRSHGKVLGSTMPYSILIALEHDAYVYLYGVKTPLPIGCAVVLRGDVLHSGSEYKNDNIRYHLYMDVKNVHVAEDGTQLQWSAKSLKKIS